jgi:hypothetical protein
MTTEKINPKIKEHLFSTDTQITTAAIKWIKSKGNKLYLPLLFDLLNAEPEKEVEDEIKDLLATVKDKSTVESFVHILENAKYKPIWKIILTTCWQNGLDYSNYTPLFIEMIINEEWEIAFEAFTIVDNLEFLPSQENIDKSVIKIKNALPTANEHKTYFLSEVLSKLT